ncbi:MAG: hypothetical protein WCO96_02705 [Actinomycetes bacterium]
MAGLTFAGEQDSVGDSVAVSSDLPDAVAEVACLSKSSRANSSHRGEYFDPVVSGQGGKVFVNWPTARRRPVVAPAQAVSSEVVHGVERQRLVTAIGARCIRLAPGGLYHPELSAVSA